MTAVVNSGGIDITPNDYNKAAGTYLDFYIEVSHGSANTAVYTQLLRMWFVCGHPRIPVGFPWDPD